VKTSSDQNQNAIFRSADLDQDSSSENSEVGETCKNLRVQLCKVMTKKLAKNFRFERYPGFDIPIEFGES
jgi:hypothetical protein